MKKLIAIAVVFVLAVGTAFAVDLGGTVFGHVNVLEGATGKDKSGDDEVLASSGGFDRLRIEGGGEAGDTFGGWIRFDTTGGNFVGGLSGLAWWKPIDMFKLTIGGNPDAIWAKEGVTGWGFNQMPYDSGIALGGGNIWGGGIVDGLKTRHAFYGGYGDPRAAIEFKPIDMLGINIAIPFAKSEGDDLFKAVVAQIDLNFDFGNIALTYDGGDGDGALFVYFGGSFGDLGLDVGIGYHLTSDSNDPAHPFYAGLGIKYATDAFGIKFRTALGIPSEDTDGFKAIFDLLPYYAFSDNVSFFFNMGVGISGPPSAGPKKDDDAVISWFINPYLRVGAEWGPTFYVGLQVSSDGVKGSSGDGDASKIKFAVPVSLMVSF